MSSRPPGLASQLFGAGCDFGPRLDSGIGADAVAADVRRRSIAWKSSASSRRRLLSPGLGQRPSLALHPHGLTCFWKGQLLGVVPPQFNDFKEFAENAVGKSWDEVWHCAHEEKARLLSFFELPLQQLVDHPDYSALSAYENAIRQLMIFLQSDTVPPNVTPPNRRLFERIRRDLKSRGHWRHLGQ